MLSVVACGVLASPVGAQLNGHNFKGDFGLTSGTQPQSGWYLSLLYGIYDTDTVKDRDGDPVTFDPALRGSITAQGVVPFAWWVSEKTFLGGTYGFAVAPSLANVALNAPIFGLDQETGFDLGDLYVQPINLGWSRARADFSAGLGLYVPIGKFEEGAEDNTGFGMWTYEVFAGTTVYFDAQRSWNLALTAFWETHSTKKDSDQRVGDLLTLEGGFGKSFAGGAINVGVAYYAQWKLSRDDFGLRVPLENRVGKHEVFGIGPEVVLPIVAKGELLALLTARYLFEQGAQSTTEGDTLFFGLTFPIGVDFGTAP